MITRPAHQAGPLTQAITHAGGQAFLFPTLEITPAELSATDIERLQQINHYDIIIFISPNAVEHGLKQINANTPLADNVLLAAIGQGTAKALHNTLGKNPDIVPETEFNSEGLLATPAMQDVTSKRILIIRGNPGRETLKQGLEQRGATVDYLSVYQRSIPEVNATELASQRALQLEQYLQKKQIAAIVMTSAESLNNLLEMVPATVKHELLQLPLVLINQRLVNVAEAAGFSNRLYVATAASDEAIIETLRKNKLLS